MEISSRFEVRNDPAVVRNFGTILVEFCKAVPDGIVAFFPSYLYMESIVSAWNEMVRFLFLSGSGRRADGSSQSILNEAMKHKLIFIETPDAVETGVALTNYRRVRGSSCSTNARLIAWARLATMGEEQYCFPSLEERSRRGLISITTTGEQSSCLGFRTRCVSLLARVEDEAHSFLAVHREQDPQGLPVSNALGATTNDFREQARLEYLRDTYRIRENDFLTFDAMRHAAQCVGRVLRGKTDYGLMIFADKVRPRRRSSFCPTDQLPSVSPKPTKFVPPSTPLSLPLTRSPPTASKASEVDRPDDQRSRHEPLDRHGDQPGEALPPRDGSAFRAEL